MPTIIFAHHSGDKEFVERLSNVLGRHYSAVTIRDTAELADGDSLIEKLESMVQDVNDCLCVVLSPSSVACNWVVSDLATMLKDDVSRNRPRVLPLVTAGCTIPSFLRDTPGIDFGLEKNWTISLHLFLGALLMEGRFTDRLPGEHVMLFSDFVGAIVDYFAPRRVEVDFHKDLCGINYIKVHNDDHSFSLYSYDTCVTDTDLINEIFNNSNNQRIWSVYITEQCLGSVQDRDVITQDIISRYGLPEDSGPYEWADSCGKMGAKALQEWKQWSDGMRGVAFIYQRWI